MPDATLRSPHGTAGGRSTRFFSRSPDETLRFGRAIGRLARAGDVFALYGQLGSGKTHLVKGIAAGAGFRFEREVTSPSFVLVHEYRGRLPIYHFDAYRLRSGTQLFDIGCDEFFYGDGISIVEWADRVQEALPDGRLDIELRHAGESASLARRPCPPAGGQASWRTMLLTPRGARYEEILRALRKPCSKAKRLLQGRPGSEA